MEEQNNHFSENQEPKEKIKETITNKKKTIPKMAIIIGAIAVAVVVIAVVLIVLLGGNNNHHDSTSHTHTYGEWETIKAATCTQEGTESRYCSCGDNQTRPLSANGHTVINIGAIQATCTTDGYTAGTSCSACGIFIVAPQKIAASHKYNSGILTTEATCTKNGMKTYTCSACNASYSETINGGHEWLDATCTSPKTCNKCSLTDGEKLGHTCDVGNCNRCKKNIDPIVNLPDLPIESSYRGEYYIATMKITSLSYKWVRSDRLRIIVSFEKIYDEEGAAADNTVRFKYRLLDSDGFVVATGGSSFFDYIVGDKIKDYECDIYLNNSVSQDCTYTLQIIDAGV